MENGAVLETPFLEIDVSFSGEQGLLGVAFHPDYATNGRFFVHYSEPGSGDTIIVEYARATGVTANPTPVRTILTVEQPYGNHNGGSIEFGPDGNLYIFLGDGGSGGDPLNSAQDLTSLLGKVLRIDVDGAPRTRSLQATWRAASPRSGTPACATPGAPPSTPAPAISTSPTSARTVGGGQLRARRAGQPQLRLAHDGGHPLLQPVDQLRRDGPHDAYLRVPALGGGRSITGGYVYRGSSIPAARGRYFFADYVTNQIWSFRQSGDAATDVVEHTAELGTA
jgi:hypothetical protein